MTKVYYRSGQTFESEAESREFKRLCKYHLEGLSAQNSLVSWKKDMFRKSSVWKSFCRKLIQKRGFVCECCGKSKKDVTLVVHHRDPWRYDYLEDESLFSVLCNGCHLKIESYCKTLERTKQCPRVWRKFLTIKPYKDEGDDVLAWQSGSVVLEEWKGEIALHNNPSTLNKVRPSVTEMQAKVAEEFMKQHPHLFK